MPDQLSFEIALVSVSSEQAIALGLIVNEFVTNSLKYAFDNTGGEIRIIAEIVDQQRLRLRLTDSGQGLDGGARRTGSGTGLQIIKGLCRQLGADPDWSSTRGTTLAIEFKLATSE